MRSVGFIFIISMFLLLLGIVATVSATAAQENTNGEGTFNADTYQLPALQFDKTQSKIIIDKELSPSVESAVSQKSRMTVASESPATVTIPSGSIIHHSKDGVTTVFDSTGQQLFAADDAQAKLVPTPRGQLPATCVHEVPSGSILYKRDNITYVISNNNLILVEIKEKSGENDNIPDRTTPGKSAGYTTLGASTAGTDNPLAYWIERVTFDTPDDMGLEYLKNYSAQWKVPNPPLTTTPNQVQYLAIEEEAFEVNNNGTVAFASVLEWNYYPNTWDITTWMHDYNGRITGYFSQREVVNTGDIISGNISSTNLYGYPPPYPIRVVWNVRSSDQSGHSSELSLNSNSLIEGRGGADTLLMLSGDTSLPSEDYLVGDTTFWSYIFTDNNDNPLNPPIRSTYINYALAGNPAFSNLRIETNNWPGKIVLGTSPPERYSYSMTEVEGQLLYRYGTDTMKNVSYWLGQNAGWRLVFSNEESKVTKQDFGINEYGYRGLNDATLHWHSGHGGYNQTELYHDSGIVLQYDDNWPPSTYFLIPLDVRKKWGGKNKWVVLDSCYLLSDPRWGEALQTSHGIFGFTTLSTADPALPSEFFRDAIEDRDTLTDAWMKATKHEFHSIPVCVKWSSNDPLTRTCEKFVSTGAAVRFSTTDQLKNDHLLGFGSVEPDDDPADYKTEFYPWDC